MPFKPSGKGRILLDKFVALIWSVTNRQHQAGNQPRRFVSGTKQWNMLPLKSSEFPARNKTIFLISKSYALLFRQQIKRFGPESEIHIWNFFAYNVARTSGHIFAFNSFNKIETKIKSIVCTKLKENISNFKHLHRYCSLLSNPVCLRGMIVEYIAKCFFCDLAVEWCFPSVTFSLILEQLTSVSDLKYRILSQRVPQVLLTCMALDIRFVGEIIICSQHEHLYRLVHNLKGVTK